MGSDRVLVTSFPTLHQNRIFKSINASLRSPQLHSRFTTQSFKNHNRMNLWHPDSQYPRLAMNKQLRRVFLSTCGALPTDTTVDKKRKKNKTTAMQNWFGLQPPSETVDALENCGVWSSKWQEVPPSSFCSHKTQTQTGWRKQTGALFYMSHGSLLWLK